MKYDVSWLPSAVSRLAEIYLNALDKRAVTEASHRIDVILSMDADSAGSDFLGRRVLMVPPLIVVFSVQKVAQHAQVVKVERCPSGNGQVG